MGFRAAFISTMHAVAGRSLVVPAAFTAPLGAVSPPAIDDGSAQGLRMPSSCGSFGGAGGGFGRCKMSGGMRGMVSGGMAGMMTKNVQTGMSGGRRTGHGNVANLPGNYGMGGM